MDVKFKYGPSANLGTLQITNGQIIALSDKGALYYDMNGTRYPAYTLPTANASTLGGGQVK